MELEIRRTISAQDVDDILCTALEGYMMSCWAIIDNTTDAWRTAQAKVVQSGRDGFMSEIICEMLEDGEALLIEDAELEEGEKPNFTSMYGEDGSHENPWKLTKKRFVEGIQKYESARGCVTKKLEDGSFDDIEADCLMQYAVFGEVIFG